MSSLSIDSIFHLFRYYSHTIHLRHLVTLNFESNSEYPRSKKIKNTSISRLGLLGKTIFTNLQGKNKKESLKKLTSFLFQITLNWVFYPFLGRLLRIDVSSFLQSPRESKSIFRDKKLLFKFRIWGKSVMRVFPTHHSISVFYRPIQNHFSSYLLYHLCLRK